MSMPSYSTLEEFEKMMQKGRQDRESSIEEAKNVLLEIANCKMNLIDLKNEIKGFQEKCKAFKTTGTVSSATGAAFIAVGCVAMLIPFAQPVGVVCSVIGTGMNYAGAAVKISTDVVDKIGTKVFLKKINASISKLQKSIGKLEKSKEDYNKTLEFLDELSNNEIGSKVNQFYAIGKNLKKGVEQMGSIGIFVIVLAMAKPGLSDGGTAVLIPIALQISEMVLRVPNFYNVASNVLPLNVVASNVVPNAAKTVVSNTLARDLRQPSAKVCEKTFRKGTEYAVKEAGTKFGVKVAETAFQGIFAGINIGIAIWDISSLIQGWNKAHPTVEAIDTVILQLTEAELNTQEFHQQLCNMVATTVDTQTEMDDDQGSEFSSSSEEEEEDDKIRIFDKSTETMKRILRTFGFRGISSLENLRGKTAIDLMQKIRGILQTASTGDFRLSSYFLLHDCVHNLISSHQAEFVRLSNTPEIINLNCSKETICFDGSFREYLRQLLLPIQSIMKIPLLDINQLCCIYRFHCIMCEDDYSEFNYVGQTINFQSRYKTHTRAMLAAWMNHEDRMAQLAEGRRISSNIKSGLHDHGLHNHPQTIRDSDCFEVDIVQRLTPIDNARVRRYWEIYNQWLYKAMVREKELTVFGGSRR